MIASRATTSRSLCSQLLRSLFSRLISVHLLKFPYSSRLTLLIFPDGLPMMTGVQSGSSNSDDEFTINENFFAGSVLHDVSSEPVRSTAQAPNNEEVCVDLPKKAFLVHRLPRCVSQKIPESHMVYVSTEDLGNRGIFNGDWASR